MAKYQLKITDFQPISKAGGPNQFIRMAKLTFTYKDFGPFSLLVNQETFEPHGVDQELNAFLAKLDIVIDSVDELTNISIIHRDGPTGSFDEHLNAEFKVDNMGPFSRFVLLRPLDVDELVEHVKAYKDKVRKVLQIPNRPQGV